MQTTQREEALHKISPDNVLPGEKKGELSPEWHVEWQINRMTNKKVFILSPHFDSSIGRNTLSSFGYINRQNVPKFVD